MMNPKPCQHLRVLDPANPPGAGFLVGCWRSQGYLWAVLSYLREEQGKQSVPFHEFAEVLEEVLVAWPESEPQADESQLPQVVKTMSWTVHGQDTGFDLMLFHLLRDGVDQSLQQGEARILWVHGLRHCVKQHLGAQRWGRRCQQFNDQLIAFIRQCFDQKAGPGYSLILHP